MLLNIMFNQQNTADYTSPFTASSQDYPLISNHSMAEPAKKDPTSLNLRALRQKKKQADKVIEILQVRINYLQHKEEETARKEVASRKRSEEMGKIRKQEEERKDMKEDAKRRFEEEMHRKIKSNSELRSSMEYNRSLINTMLGVNREREVLSVKNNKRKLHQQHQLNLQKSTFQLFEKVRKIKQQRMTSNQKAQLYYLSKMVSLKAIRQQKLNLQLKQRKKNEQKLSELRQTQTKLEKIAVFSEKYRHQCQSQYYSSRLKYREFHKSRREMKKSVSARSQPSVEDNDSGIFLS